MNCPHCNHKLGVSAYFKNKENSICPNCNEQYELKISLRRNMLGFVVFIISWPIFLFELVEKFQLNSVIVTSISAAVIFIFSQKITKR
jgi:uncharacterized protein (DUF983 family)